MPGLLTNLHRSCPMGQVFMAPMVNLRMEVRCYTDSAIDDEEGMFIQDGITGIF